LRTPEKPNSEIVSIFFGVNQKFKSLGIQLKNLQKLSSFTLEFSCLGFFGELKKIKKVFKKSEF
jgi:hypothetical protein